MSYLLTDFLFVFVECLSLLLYFLGTCLSGGVVESLISISSLAGIRTDTHSNLSFPTILKQNFIIHVEIFFFRSLYTIQ